MSADVDQQKTTVSVVICCFHCFRLLSSQKRWIFLGAISESQVGWNLATFILRENEIHPLSPLIGLKMPIMWQ